MAMARIIPEMATIWIGRATLVCGKCGDGAVGGEVQGFGVCTVGGRDDAVSTGRAPSRALTQTRGHDLVDSAG